jgi:hypothetical protein
MHRIPAFAFALLILLAVTAVRADVWFWVDANGEKHYVDSQQAIYTWRDEKGKVHYSDKPDHEDAIRVQLFWHAKGTLENLQRAGDATGTPGSVDAYPAETAEERSAREVVVARNCERASEILRSYENAPKLYRTDESGKRHILTEAEYAAEVADAREKTRFLCSQ